MDIPYCLVLLRPYKSNRFASIGLFTDESVESTLAPNMTIRKKTALNCRLARGNRIDRRTISRAFSENLSVIHAVFGNIYEPTRLLKRTVSRVEIKIILIIHIWFSLERIVRERL